MPQARLTGAAQGAVLFDFDGTLVDSAPDLAATANEMLAHRGLPMLAHELLRPHCGSGARGMIRAAFGVLPADTGYAALRDEFMQRYERCMLDRSMLFAAATGLLDALDARGLRWGIVTNKSLRLAEPMARALGLLPRAAVLIGGDSTPHTKPHPAPLLEAARRLSLPPARCVYVGDDERDVQAGRAAGMATLAAAWGYTDGGRPIDAWGADCVLQDPMSVLNWLDMA